MRFLHVSLVAIKTRLLPSFLSFAAFLVLSFAPASAQTASWNGSTAAYSTAADWSTGSEPSETTNVSISSGTVTYGDSGYLTRTATTTISGTGDLIITNNRFENANSGNATVNVSGSGVLTQTTGQYFIVAHAGIGAINQSGGSVSSTVTTGWGLSDNANSVGTYNLTGGTLNVTDTAGGASSYGVSIGRNSGSDVMDINGGTANFGTAGTADVRTYVSNGATLRVDSGTATFNQFDYLTVGRITSTATSHVLVDGGTLSFNNLLNNGGTGGGISIGNGGAGLIAVSSGTLNLNETTGVTDYVNVGDGANGAITQTGGVINTNMDIVLSNKTGNTGTYTMSGGTLLALDISEGVGGLGTFDFTGGQIYLDGNQTSLIGDAWFDGAAGTTATFNALNDTTEIYIAAVPEPSSCWLALLAAGMFVLWRRQVKSVN